MVSIDTRFIDDCDIGNAKAIACSYPLMISIDKLPTAPCQAF